MRKIICIFLTVVFLLLAGCSSSNKDNVSFYYCRDPGQYQYFEADSVICSESRDLMNHRYDLQYMVGLYLAGPMEEGLAAPFTKGTILLSVEKSDGSILIELSDHSTLLTDAEFSLSCACLTLTCMEFTSCEDVTIVSGSRSLTLDADSILLQDTLPQQETTGG